MHKDIYDDRENTGDHRTVYEAYRPDVPSEHDCVNLYGHDDIAVQKDSKNSTEKNSCYSQDDIFPQHIL